MHSVSFKIPNHLNGREKRSMRVIERQLVRVFGWGLLTQREADLITHSQELTEGNLVVWRQKTQFIHSGWERITWLTQMHGCIPESIQSGFPTQCLTTGESLPLQGMLHCLLIVGSHHNISSSVECNLIQHIVQTPLCEHTDVNIIILLRTVVAVHL